MLCPHCGADSPKNVRFCTECGSAMPEIAEKKESSGGNLIGFSSRINDPAFARYVKNKKRWALLFASILAVIVIVGFFIYGQTSSEMDNPQALFIGLGIGGMFITIALLACLSISRSTTWDGTVVDKKIEQKKRRHRTGDNDYYWEKYTLYTVVIKSDSGKIHNKTTEDNDTDFNYYQIGDKVRHHGGLDSFEKYDKSKDTIIFCNACGTLHDIQDDTCVRCNCPLLK